MSSRSLSFGIKRKRFSIDGDESRYIELDTADTGIVTRWNELEPWFNGVADRLKAMDIPTDGEPTEEIIDNVTGELATLDNELRENLNILFDYDVCTPIAGSRGSLIRTVDGEPLFYTILTVLVPLYEADIKVEAEKSKKRISKHTSKYIPE